jgi:hypothetical protein
VCGRGLSALLAEQGPKALVTDVVDHPLSDQEVGRLDRAYDLDADDPRIDDVACRIADATRERYGPNDRPELDAGRMTPMGAIPRGEIWSAKRVGASPRRAVPR